MSEQANDSDKPGGASGSSLSSQAAHTPGPWSFFEAPCNTIEVRGPGKIPVVPWPAFDDSDRPIAEHVANARLIAAAPELLEALAEVLSTGLNGGNNYRLAMIAASQKALDDETLERAEASERAVQKAWAAIKKARGAEA